MGYEMERPSVKELSEKFKAEERKDTQVRIRLNILKRYCKELTALADELENEIKIGEPYHIKETATKIINYIKGY